MYCLTNPARIWRPNKRLKVAGTRNTSAISSGGLVTHGNEHRAKADGRQLDQPEPDRFVSRLTNAHRRRKALGSASA
jgi:hypothetical protein